MSVFLFRNMGFSHSSGLFLAIIFFLKYFLVNSQPDTLYLDENDKYISKDNFYKKAESEIYGATRYVTDTLVIGKLEFNYFFSELSGETKSQLFKLFAIRHQIDTAKTLIIHYEEVLKNKLEYPKYSYVEYYDSLSQKMDYIKNGYDLEKYGKRIVERKTILDYESFLRAHENCIKINKRYGDNLTILHFFNQNNGHPIEVKRLKWYKDYGAILKNLFYDNDRKFAVLFIRPDGEYYLLYKNGKYLFEDLLKSENWNLYRNDFLEELRSLNIKT